jgi:heptosyltransferase-2
VPADPAPPRILALRFSSIGDVVLTTPLLRALRARHPQAAITFVTKRAMAPLVANHPAVNEVLALEPGGSLFTLAAQLRQRRFTHLLDLHGTLRAGLLRLLVPGRWRGFNHRRRERATLIATKRDIYPEHLAVAERYFEAAEGLDVRPDGRPAEFYVAPDATTRAAAWLAETGLGQSRHIAVLAPGAAHFTKRWPMEGWVGLAQQLTGDDFDLALVGGADDVKLCQVIAGLAGPRAAVAAGRFGLQDTGALLRSAAVCVSGDTGVMHLATASGTPVVALMGPTVRPFGFFPYQASATVLERDLDCRPCSAHGGARCPLGHHRCLRDIGHAEVATAVRSLSR